VAIAAAGLFGAYHYVWTFWLYRGFPPPEMPRQVAVAPELPVTRQAPVSRLLPVLARQVPVSQRLPVSARQVPVSLQVRVSAPARRAPVPAWAHGARFVPVLPGTLETIDLDSPVAGRKLPTIVYLPPGYFAHPEQRYPSLYLLHGVPGYAKQFVDIGDVQVAEALLVARHQMPPTVIVMPQGGSNNFDDTEWVNGVGPGSAWMSYVAGEVVAAVDRRFRVIDSGADRAIGGLSEGGYGALNIALHHPGEFGVIESWSGYMQASTDPQYFGSSETLAAANTPYVEVRRERAALVSDHTYFWFYCGQNDDVFGQNEEFNDELATLGLPHAFDALPGEHDWAIWRDLMSQALIVAGDHFAGVQA
jgi:enterochelin esterase-like enzyme